MSDLVKARLCGGPFDGSTRRLRDDELVPTIYVRGCSGCGAHWYRDEVRGAEVYRRDEERGGWMAYVFTDRSLSRPERQERELVPAGAPEESQSA